MVCRCLYTIRHCHNIMNIYFVRHGITGGNESNQYQLPTIELSEQGINQAQFVAKRFKTIPVELIFASPMTRASQTASIIADSIGLKVMESSLFEEIKRPSIVCGRSKNEPDVKSVMKIVKETFADPDKRHSDEEDYFQLKDRAEEVLKFLSERNENEILVVTHGEILRMILSLVIFGKELTPEIFDQVRRTFIPHNTGITVIQYDLSFEFHKSGWYVLSWNDYAHLGNVR